MRDAVDQAASDLASIRPPITTAYAVAARTTGVFANGPMMSELEDSDVAGGGGTGDVGLGGNGFGVHRIDGECGSCGGRSPHDGGGGCRG